MPIYKFIPNLMIFIIFILSVEQGRGVMKMTFMSENDVKSGYRQVTFEKKSVFPAHILIKISQSAGKADTVQLNYRLCSATGH